MDKFGYHGCPHCGESVGFMLKDIGTTIPCQRCSTNVEIPYLPALKRRVLEMAEKENWDGCIDTLREIISCNDPTEASLSRNVLAIALLRRARTNTQRALEAAAELVGRELAKVLGTSTVVDSSVLGSLEWTKRLLKLTDGGEIKYTKSEPQCIKEMVCNKCPLCGKGWSKRRRVMPLLLPGGGFLSLCMYCAITCFRTKTTIDLYTQVQGDLWESNQLNPKKGEVVELFEEQERFLEKLPGYVSPKPPTVFSRFCLWLSSFVKSNRASTEGTPHTSRKTRSSKDPSNPSRESEVSSHRAIAAGVAHKPRTAAGVDFLRFPCPACGRQLKAPQSARGKKARCTKCGKPVNIPARSESEKPSEISTMA